MTHNPLPMTDVLNTLSFACPARPMKCKAYFIGVKQPAGLPIPDRGFSGELSTLNFELRTLNLNIFSLFMLIILWKGMKDGYQKYA